LFEHAAEGAIALEEGSVERMIARIEAHVDVTWSRELVDRVHAELDVA